MTLGYSPCPNDCFIFDALVHKKIDTGTLAFDEKLEDIETLNKWASESKLDITKISFHAYAYVADKYQFLHSGGALGNNCGPILISKTPHQLADVMNLKIAIPGKLTTANFLLALAFPEAKNKTEIIFSGIEGRVLSGEFDAGLIIHENRFTYQQKGLKKIIDLGEWWESTYHAPIPLAGIAIKRNLPDEVKQKTSKLIRKSVEFAFANPNSSYDYVKQYAQEMDENVRKQHIALYVNDFSIDFGNKGSQAIEKMYSIAHQHNIIPNKLKDIFIAYN
jgi:1,4-dihydroxy-6-naphthoate synthase